ncbi:MAG: hypothetical protein U0271_03855 [Polyangiaceae bacterium]
MLLVATIHVRREALETFKIFEFEAARIMEKHGGRLERAVVLRGRHDEPHRELHIVYFPSPDAYEAYRVSPELATFMHLRETSVLKTEIQYGEDEPDYHVAPPSHPDL